MKNTLLFTTLLLLTAFSQAQPQPVGHLTVFSEDGDKFYLVLNGERQNTVAQTNLRVEDLTQDYYNAKIIFEDKTLPDISKNYLGLADANGVKQDVTYKIKKDKNNGKLSLKYFSMAPVVQGYIPPREVTVVHYGTPAPAPAPVATSVTKTTTTTTTAGNTVGADVNVAGVNMSVTINDPLLSATTTTTTRTTTTKTTTTNDPPRPRPTDPATRPLPTSTKTVGCSSGYPMGATDFSSALSTIKNQGFDETRLNTAKQIASSNCLSTTQITQICQAFGFEQSKLDFAKYAYDFCTEPKNYFKVNNVFGFSSSTDELNEYIQNRR